MKTKNPGRVFNAKTNGEKQSIKIWLTLIPKITRIIHIIVKMTNAGTNDINDFDTRGGTVSGKCITRSLFWKKCIIIPDINATKIAVNNPFVPNNSRLIAYSSVSVANKNAATETNAVINGSILISV